MTYLEALAAELAAAGLPAHRRRRIVAEFADHLNEDPGAQLGSPRELAREFADQLGARLARSAAVRTTAALAILLVPLVIELVAPFSLVPSHHLRQIQIGRASPSLLQSALTVYFVIAILGTLATQALAAVHLRRAGCGAAACDGSPRARCPRSRRAGSGRSRSARGRWPGLARLVSANLWVAGGAALCSQATLLAVSAGLRPVGLCAWIVSLLLLAWAAPPAWTLARVARAAR